MVTFHTSGLSCKTCSLSEVCTLSLRRKNGITQHCINWMRLLFYKDINSVFDCPTLPLHLTLITSSKTLCPNTATVDTGFHPMPLEQSRAQHLTEAAFLTTALRCTGQTLSESLLH